jgi:hypothetical protein
MSTTRTALTALALAAAAAAGGCLNLDDITTVKDLRVLAVQADHPGFLVNLDDPGSANPFDLTGSLTALVVDPKGGGAQLTFTAVGCPDYLDAITGASTHATNLCATPGTDGALPSLLQSMAIATFSPADPIAPGGIEYRPATGPWGLTPDQVGAFFTPTPPADPTLAKAVQYNRDFGIDALANLTFVLGSEQATAVKRLVYWPLLDPTQVPNQNPIIDHIEFYGARDATTGQPINLLDPIPTVSVGALDKVYALPVPPAGQTWDDQSETYLLRVRNAQTMQVETQTVKELMTFDFFTTVGTLAPAERRNDVPIFAAPGSMIHIDSQLNLPAPANVPAGGVTADVWVVVHDERAGVSWAHGNVIITP